jgi:hypothetical protein
MTPWVYLSRTKYCSPLLLIAGVIAGCGGNSLIVSSPPGSAADVTGNWVLTAGIAPGGGGRQIAAYLSSNNGAVSGSAVVEGACPTDCANGCCGGPFCAGFNGSLSGTVDANGNLKLGSAVANGGPVFSMSATAGQGQLSNGAFTLTGTCPAQGAIGGTEYPTLAGTYSGTLTSTNTGKSFAISETVDQSSSLNSSGYFDVTATANLSGYSCVTSATEATPVNQNSGFLGDGFTVNMIASPGGMFFLTGTISPDGKTMAANYEYALLGSTCNIDIGSGTLTLQ